MRKLDKVEVSQQEERQSCRRSNKEEEQEDEEKERKEKKQHSEYHWMFYTEGNSSHFKQPTVEQRLYATGHERMKMTKTHYVHE